MDFSGPISMLIDADNVSPKMFDDILSEVVNYGTPIVKRIYGDWSSEQLNGWKKLLQIHALTPIQVSPNKEGKNATDIALVIDAMDLLYSKDLAGFCIISSDSDYTKLSLRIRESNKFVVGIGNKKSTHQSFVNACDKFIYYDTLESKYQQKTQERHDRKMLRQDTKLLNAIRNSIEDLTSETNDEINLGYLKSKVISRFPDFDPRNYGYIKFSELIEEIGFWKLDKKNRNLIFKEEG